MDNVDLDKTAENMISDLECTLFSNFCYSLTIVRHEIIIFGTFLQNGNVN